MTTTLKSADTKRNFLSYRELRAWLADETEGFGMDGEDAAEVAEKLFNGGYKSPSTFYEITKEDLIECGLTKPLANTALSGWDQWKRKQQPQGAAASYPQPAVGPFHLIPYNEASGGDLVVHLGEVRTFDELRARVASCADVAESKFVLFVGQNNGGGRTKFSKLTSLQELKNIPRKDGAPILLRYQPPGASTPSSSLEQKRQEVPFSKSLHQTLFSLPVSFSGSIPDFYEDAAYKELTKDMSDPPTDNPSMLLMAIPGAGKTRTVEQAARSLGASYYREKLTDAHPLIQQLRQMAKKEKGPPKCYATGKDVFVATCKDFVHELIEKISTDQKKIQVMHFDEVQLLMGSKVVSQAEDSENIFDYVMPAFGDAVNLFTSERKNLRVALSGTNFFAALVFNSGSHLKVKHYPLEGGFPLDYGKKLLKTHFDFNSVPDEDQDALIEPMCANRRALHFLAYKLELGVGIDKEVSREALREAAEAAYGDWITPILICIKYGRKAALSLLALIAYPSAWNGTVTNGRLKLPTHELPKEVKQYALGGAVNIHHDVKSQTDEILIPVGCTLRFLFHMCDRATDFNNMKEYEFFINTSRSVLSDKGHFFQRMIACELTFLSSKLYKTLLLPTGMTFNPDPRMLGRPFVYDARTHMADWKRGQVYCVLEDPQCTGKKIIDFGFPVVTLQGSEPWRVCCEAKVVQNQNALWRMCWAFFEKMKGFGVGDDKCKTVAVFLAFHKFKHHEPAPRKTTKGLSACDSRERVLELLREEAMHFVALDGEELATAKTVLPVVDLYKLIEEKEPTNHSVMDLTDQVAQVHTSSSQQLQPMGSPASKRMRM